VVKPQVKVSANQVYSNWEVPEAVDEAAITRAIDAAIQDWQQQENKNQIILVEGFLLFSFPNLLRRFAKKIFLTISKKTCFQRRMATTPVPVPYFEHILWPAFCKYNAVICQQADVLILDGERKADDLLKDALDYLENRSVASSPLHQRNITDHEDLSKHYDYYLKTGEVHMREAGYEVAGSDRDKQEDACLIS